MIYSEKINRVDGVDPELIKDVLDILIVTSNKTCMELLSDLIVRDGLLPVQAGEDLRLIKIKLMAYIGDVEFPLAEVRK